MNEPLENHGRQNAFALIIGIGQYRDARIPKLNYTHADAKAFYELLVDPKRSGFPKDNVRLLLDSEATFTAIRKSVNQWLHRAATAESTVIVFFAGHGGQEQDKCDPDPGQQAYYFLPWDADPEDLASTALSQSDFERLLRTLRSQRMVIFLDACHSTGVAKPGARDLCVVAAPKYERLAEGEGRVVIAAAKPEQRSWEDDKLQHGIFTYHLLEAMRGKADTNGDGYVSIQEVAGYLQRKVPETVRSLGKEPQDPTMICEALTRDIILTVDAELVERLARKRDDEERRRLEEMHSRRLKLVDLRKENELPLAEYAEAMQIIEKAPEELTTTEKVLKKWLDLLLTDRWTAGDYLESRARIRAGTNIIRREKFCIHCGARNPPDNVFCLQCGKRLG